MATDPSLEEIAAVLDNAKIRHGELRAACPAHGGEDANLSITYDNGKLLARCNSHHCPFPEIMSAIRGKLGETNGRVVNITHGKKRKKKVKGRQEWDVEGVARHVRTEYEDGTKDFSWRLPDGSWGLGGMGTSELPLYGTSEALRVPEKPVVVVEGEKARDALRGADICAVATVTGANGTPGEKALEPFRGRVMILWPDNDRPGHEHMGRVATGLVGVGADVRWFEWSEIDKGDAADHPAITGSEDRASLLEQLEEARRWSKPPPIEGLIRNMGEIMDRGIEEPEELLADVLLVGKAHNIFAPGGIGKTWVLIWIAKELCEAGKRVVIFDVENGLRTYMERFDELDTDRAALNRNLVYGQFSRFDPISYALMLDQEKPDIVMFDSWIGFLAADARDENLPNDIALWANDYSKPALRRGCAICVLDHVGHENPGRERGARRKRDEMDVVWKLTQTEDFDRNERGLLKMFREKDRESWLPREVAWEIGGGDQGFQMFRNDRLAEQVKVTYLDQKERVVRDTLATLGKARRKDLLEALLKVERMSSATLTRVLRRLKEKEKVVNEEGFWSVSEIQESSISDTGSTGSQLDHDPLIQAPRGTGSLDHPPKGGVIPGDPVVSGDGACPTNELDHEVDHGSEERDVDRHRRLWRERRKKSGET